jgi:hypothetical protein
MLRKQKMCTYGLSAPWNIASSTTKVDFSDVQKADYEFSGPIAYLKHHLDEFVRVALFKAQDSENEFAWPWNSLKHRIIDFLKVIF